MLRRQYFYFSLSPPLSPAVPAPTVEIVPIGTPINGTLYNLSCTVRVMDSVNTGVCIYSEWLLPNEEDNSLTISNVSEAVVRLEQRHNLTFTPLRGADGGVYVCHANITPSENTEFIVGSFGNESYFLTVESKTSQSLGGGDSLCVSAGLPPPTVNLSISSTSVPGESGCLGIAFTADTISCVAGVASNLLRPPNMYLTRNENLVRSESGQKLTHILRPGQNSGTFNCSVCIEIEEAEIFNHCNYTTLTLSAIGECCIYVPFISLSHTH